MLYATGADGAPMTAFVRLSAPGYDSAKGTLTLAAQLLPADASKMALAGGVTNQAAMQSAAGAGMAPLTAAPVGAELTDVALFIDESALAVRARCSRHELKGGWVEVGPCCEVMPKCNAMHDTAA